MKIKPLHFGLLLIFAIAAFLRFYHIGKLSLEGDELSTMWFITHDWKTLLRLGPDQYLYYVFQKGWMAIFPHAADGLARALPALFSVISVPVVYLLGTTFGITKKQGVWIGSIAALLVGLNAFHIQYAQEARGYSLVFLLSLASTYVLMQAVRNSDDLTHRRWLLYGLLSVGAIYSHSLAAFVTMTQFLSLVILWLGRKDRRFPYVGLIDSVVIILVLCLPALKAISNEGVGHIQWIPDVTIKQLLLVGTALAGNQSIWLFVAYGMAMLLGVYVIWPRLKSKDVVVRWEVVLLISCAFMPLVINLAVSSIITPVLVPRYLLYVLPYWVILVALGVDPTFHNRWYDKVLCAALVGLMAVLSVVGTRSYYLTYQKEDFRGAAQYVTNECSDALRLYHVFYTQEKFTYYNPAITSQIPQREWRSMIDAKPSATELAETLPQGKRVCLILWSLALPERREQTDLIRSALLSQYSKVDVASFYRIDIEVYER